MVSQNMVLNKIIQTKDMSLITMNNLDDKYFFNYTAEFNFIKNHYDKYKAVPDKLTFANVFPNFDFVDVNEPNTFLIEQLFSDYNTQYIVTSFNNVRKLIQAGDTEKAKELYEKSYDGLHTGAVMTCTDILKDTSRYERYLERTTDPKKYYLTTGFIELDKAIGGLDRENENMVIFARTGQGKTQILLAMATAASKAGLTVGIYEGEMTPDKVGYRIDTYLGHIKNKEINRGDIFIQKDYKRYIDSLQSCTYGPIKVFTPNDVPGGIVTVNTLRTFVEMEHIDVLFVDQYDLLDDLSNAKVKHEKIGNIARDVKLLQVEKHIPIVSVCQQTREKNDDNSVDSTQVAGSDMISRYATILIALEQKYNEVTNTVELDFNVVKARDGGDHNKLKYNVNFNTGEFNYIPNDKDGITTAEDMENIEDSYNSPIIDEGLPF